MSALTVCKCLLSRSALLALALSLTACGGEPGSSQAPAPAPAANDADTEAAAETASPRAEQGAPAPGFDPGQSWSLAASSVHAVSAEAGVFIEVQDGRLVGYAGCNRFSAGMQQGQDGSLSIEVPVASKRACADPALNAAEQAFLQALPRLNRFELAADRLRLAGEDGLLLEFTPGRPGEAETPSE